MEMTHYFLDITFLPQYSVQRTKFEQLGIKMGATYTVHTHIIPVWTINFRRGDGSLKL